MFQDSIRPAAMPQGWMIFTTDAAVSTVDVQTDSIGMKQRCQG